MGEKDIGLRRIFRALFMMDSVSYVVTKNRLLIPSAVDGRTARKRDGQHVGSRFVMPMVL